MMAVLQMECKTVHACTCHDLQAVQQPCVAAEWQAVQQGSAGVWEERAAYACRQVLFLVLLPLLH